MSWERRKLNVCDLGDVFYGYEDYMELNEIMYNEDVIESMRRVRESKEERKREKKRSSSFFGQCFSFLRLLRSCFKLC
ncbi:hypothetical protein VIGAN_06256500 [Vigna angularis var. angularis]|uniref:Uncharacterized protein n=1 Tax=Vigna angularis var. angularis TaxID=157739 RepID=A0A0S3SEI4_PHAAN|nr:hypothetical protein VIGAN_06256500 [Vigna angularis var. angularis]